MYYVNILIFSSIILLVSLFQRIKGDFDVIKEQREIASRPQLENNFIKTPGESVITTAITVDDEKFDDNELRKLFVRNFKLYENFERGRNRNGALGTIRKTRDVPNNASKYGVECLSCFSNGSSAADDCYKANKVNRMKKIKCAPGEQCYTEINPAYVKRGCMIYGRLNRTFYCRCPLCNDKPAFDYSYYEYKTLGDWAYDNYLLQKPMKSLDVLCKVCETLGTNALADKNCRIGKTSDYMVCGFNQLCYINIDDEIDHVSRGCKTRPAFNSFYHVCNKSLCNRASLINPFLDKTFVNKEFLRLGNIRKLTARSSAPTQSSSLNFIMILLLFFYLKI